MNRSVEPWKENRGRITGPGWCPAVVGGFLAWVAVEKLPARKKKVVDGECPWNFWGRPGGRDEVWGQEDGRFKVRKALGLFGRFHAGHSEWTGQGTSFLPSSEVNFLHGHWNSSIAETSCLS